MTTQTSDCLLDELEHLSLTPEAEEEGLLCHEDPDEWKDDLWLDEEEQRPRTPSPVNPPPPTLPGPPQTRTEDRTAPQVDWTAADTWEAEAGQWHTLHLLWGEE